MLSERRWRTDRCGHGSMPAANPLLIWRQLNEKDYSNHPGTERTAVTEVLVGSLEKMLSGVTTNKKCIKTKGPLRRIIILHICAGSAK